MHPCLKLHLWVCWNASVSGTEGMSRHYYLVSSMSCRFFFLFFVFFFVFFCFSQVAPLLFCFFHVTPSLSCFSHAAPLLSCFLLVAPLSYFFHVAPLLYRFFYVAPLLSCFFAIFFKIAYPSVSVKNASLSEIVSLCLLKMHPCLKLHLWVCKNASVSAIEGMSRHYLVSSISCHLYFVSAMSRRYYCISVCVC